MAQHIRPSLAELSDYDQPAFPELDTPAQPAARVTRARPPTVASSLPPPIPFIKPSSSTTPAEPEAKPHKLKSRFALQREKEAAAAAQRATPTGAERFELSLDELDAEVAGHDDGLPRRDIIKDVLERPTSRPKPSAAPGPSRPSPLAPGNLRPTGFPAPGRGVFPRKSQAPAPTPSASASSSPRVFRTSSLIPPTPTPSSSDAASLTSNPTDSLSSLLTSVSRENEDLVSRMSEEEILEEQRQIREEMGLSEGVLRMLQMRGQRRRGEGEKKREGTMREESRQLPVERKEEAKREEEDIEEGSPEYIRRHFFPNEPPNPALDWTRPVPPPSTSSSSTPASLQTRTFDLTGAPVASSTATDSPAEAALSTDHHVSSSTTFTIPSLLALTGSSVPSQRSTALTILERILVHSRAKKEGEEKEWDAVRVECAKRAGWAVRDANVGVVVSSLVLAQTLLEGEVRRVEKRGGKAKERRLDGAEEPATVLSAFLDSEPLLPLTKHLDLAALPASALLDILSILSLIVDLARTSASPSNASDILDSLFSTPRLLEAVSSAFIAVSWPPAPSSTTPSPAALNFLTSLARSSRTRAKQLATRSLIDSTMRFVALPPWDLELSADQKVGDDLFCATLELWSTLARYGLATDLRAKSSPLLETLHECISDPSFDPSGRDARWTARYLELISLWTTAATDPHVTGHDVTWSQVEGLREVVVEAYERAMERDGEGAKRVVAAAWEALGSWVEGSKVNKSRRGEDERRWVRERFEAALASGGEAERMVLDALRMVEEGGEGHETATRVAAAALRLSQALEDEAEPANDVKPLLDIPQDIAARVVRAIVRQSPSLVTTAIAVSLLPRIALPDRLDLTLALLPLLHVEDAVTARDLVDWVFCTLSNADASFSTLAALDTTLELPALARSSILRPFVTHAIVTATGGRVVGPLYPTPQDLKLTGCLAPFAPTDPVLSPDWPLCALDELLRSATSPVFQRLPDGWDASEVELVQTSLALMRVVYASPSVQQKPDPPTLIFDLIKVFMLEKDNGATTGTSGATAEVFRDETVQRSMTALLEPLAIKHSRSKQILQPDTRTSDATIEGVSARLSTAPFYQLFTDLVGLYDSISLSDRLFGLVLIPPLAMSYPADYRRLIWTDYAHILRHLRFSVDDAISDVDSTRVETALASYLEPRETNEALLMAYVDALSSGAVSEESTPFLHFVALHHVASAVCVDEADSASTTAAKLVKALVARRADKVLQQVVRYRQAVEGEDVKVPPACFDEDEAFVGERQQRLRALVGDGGSRQLDALLAR
ncbi:RHTO0S09e05556g1_1 [Rhodotorula toruloides]|uniref:RHTO0S09e05556g1_1 n=1 Tax=Rhodotorula toruloides TaxID=5286 RepID=A0A061B9H9_RHOTO|nr:RHTO0S09e05556g1_1 [Rhodotorula toruloides]